jgi:hypothetical protein
MTGHIRYISIYSKPYVLMNIRVGTEKGNVKSYLMYHLQCYIFGFKFSNTVDCTQEPIGNDPLCDRLCTLPHLFNIRCNKKSCPCD